jgi:hypothetical protein
MRYLFTIAVLACGAFAAQADEPTTKYYFIDGKVEAVEQRVTALEKEVALLKAQLAAKSGPVVPSRVVSSGCGCTASTNCGASFCKANGGGGCPSTCPIKKSSVSALPLGIEEVWATDQNGQKVKVLVEGRVNPNRDGAVEASYPRTFATLQYVIPSSSQGGCVGGNCPSSQKSRPLLFPKLRGW